MKTIKYVVALFLVMAFSQAQAVDGLISVKSSYSAQETMNKFEDVVKSKGLNVFARINHAAGAEKAGMALRPTELLIFGNAQGGTPFMKCAQTVAIDLPLKALVWEDESGQVWLGYNDPTYLAKRHDVSECAVAEKLRGALAGFVKMTLTP
ncbi:DUF302 domain-containing protein [Marinobacter sp.]|uniref:DUF302 domain-containing protein n=1 Tax=Marinobacter sp. TaxID=50741 RepID=UPI003A95C083